MKNYFKDYGSTNIEDISMLLTPVIKLMSENDIFQYGFKGQRLSDGTISYGEGKTEPWMKQKLKNWTIWRNGFEDKKLLNFIKEFDKSGVARIRLMRCIPRSCYFWHSDVSRRLHIPIITNTSSFLVIEDEVCHLTQGHLWLTETKKMHTAFNGGTEDRYHLVYEYFGDIPYEL